MPSKNLISRDKIRIYLLISILFKLILQFSVSPIELHSQIMSSNTFKYKPQIFDEILFRDSNSTNFLTNTHFNTEFIISNNSFQNEKDRIYRLNGALEIYSSYRDMLLLNFSNELNANSLNDIALNPRQSIWEENLTYLHNFGTYQNKQFMGNISFFHRCKHEVDNTDSPAGDAPSPDYEPTKRVIILTGVNTGLTISNKDFHINQNGNKIKNDFRYVGKFDLEYYFYSSDIRQPRTEIEFDWNNLIASSRFNFRLDYNIYKDIHIFNGTELTLFWFKKLGAKINHKIELGTSIKGKKLGLDVYFVNQFMFDELAFVTQNSTLFFGVGVRLIDLNFF